VIGVKPNSIFVFSVFFRGFDILKCVLFRGQGRSFAHFSQAICACVLVYLCFVEVAPTARTDWPMRRRQSYKAGPKLCVSVGAGVCGLIFRLISSIEVRLGSVHLVACRFALVLSLCLAPVRLPVCKCSGVVLALRQDETPNMTDETDNTVDVV